LELFLKKNGLAGLPSNLYQDETMAKLSGKLYQQRKENQEQLRKINLLFGPNSANYETIDFNGLYDLLKQIAERERERERERETKITEHPEDDEEKSKDEGSHKILTKEQRDQLFKGLAEQSRKTNEAFNKLID
jgi:hypothetical protein